MAVPIAYSIRNLSARKLTTLLTAGGMALVVFVFTAMQMLDAGLTKTLVQTGSPENMLVIRKGSETEVQSGVSRLQAAVIESQQGIVRRPDGMPMVSKETVVLINLVKRGSDKPSNVVIRGMGEQGLGLRPQVKLTAGRMFTPGTSEIVAGASVARSFSGAGIGETMRFGQRDWTVVGTFDGGGTGFDSEIWGDVEQLMQAFRRTAYSSVIAKLASDDDLARVNATIDSDPRLTLQAKRETVFYAEQSKALSDFLRIFGTALSVIFSLGAIIGATITMYASVANRVTEIGTLRALGFGRRAILATFLLEALALGLVSGIAGVALASFMQSVSFSTTNFQSFAELAFNFTLTPAIAVKAILFACVMGIIGGFLPSVRAARMKIVDALRQ
jgi:ABC-type antimicrobial peptide transport system permease subunit